MLNKSHGVFFLFLSENETTNDFSEMALVCSALDGACLLMSSSKEIKSALVWQTVCMFLCTVTK